LASDTEEDSEEPRNTESKSKNPNKKRKRRGDPKQSTLNKIPLDRLSDLDAMEVEGLLYGAPPSQYPAARTESEIEKFRIDYETANIEKVGQFSKFTG